MRLKSVQILNFKSIKEITIPFEPYGHGVNTSHTSFLVGLNESGKSAILNAISLIENGLENIDYETYCNLEAQDEDELIDIFGNFELNEQEYWKKLIPNKFGLRSEIWEKIKIITFTKNVYKNIESGASVAYTISTNCSDFPLYEYVVTKKTSVTNGITTNSETIGLLKSTNAITENITKDNAEKFLKSDQRILKTSDLEKWIVGKIKDNLIQRIPKIQIWKATPDFLISEQINLNDFKANPSISIPLKNIFQIFGKKTETEIKTSIEKALSNQARRDELQEKLSDAITKYINKIWKEHKIKIHISINGAVCQVLVEDKDKKFSYYNMAQRSDGFKQFISLILSISAQNDSDNLKNNIILIDEPEVHLHPSGIKYMKDEILKIGKNNSVIVSTHSQYMIDTLCPERHFIVTKNKAKTEINQLSNNANITDDNILSAAFGLNIFKELIPENIIVVEGGDDKIIFTHCLKQLFNGFFFSMKSAGGASKMPGFARLLQEEEIKAFFLFDSDKEGRDNKQLILENQRDFYSIKNVFTLKDVLSSIPSESTLEDLYSFQFVKTFFEKELNQTFNLDENKALIIQLKEQCEILKKNKQKLESLKVKLSNKFCEDFKTSKAIEKNEKLKDFIVALMQKIQESKTS